MNLIKICRTRKHRTCHGMTADSKGNWHWKIPLVTRNGRTRRSAEALITSTQHQINSDMGLHHHKRPQTVQESTWDHPTPSNSKFNAGGNNIYSEWRKQLTGICQCWVQNDKPEIRWDFDLGYSSHKQAQANQPNVVIMNRKRTWMIDVTVPTDSNIE